MSHSEELQKSADAKLKSLEDRIISLEASNNKGPDSGEEALRSYQQHILGKLKQIREALVTTNNEDVGNSVQFQAVKAERDQLAEENKKLKVEIDRLNYRVKHLIKALNTEEEKNRSVGK